MPGGRGRKVWTRETVASADLQDFLQDQTVMHFSSAAARAAAIPAPTDGMVTYLDDVKRADVYEDAAWQPAFYGTPQVARGSSSANSDGNGWVTVSHGLGAAPVAVVVTPGGSAVQHVVKLIVAAKTSTQLSVVAYNTTTGAVLASNPTPFDWVAYR